MKHLRYWCRGVSVRMSQNLFLSSFTRYIIVVIINKLRMLIQQEEDKGFYHIILLINLD